MSNLGGQLSARRISRLRFRTLARVHADPVPWRKGLNRLPRGLSIGAVVAAVAVACTLPLTGAPAGASRAGAGSPSPAAIAGRSFERIGRAAMLPARASVLGP